MNSAELIALIVGSGGVGAVISAAINALSNRRQVRADEFKAIVEALNKRIDDLQKEVDVLKRDLGDERRAHENTRYRFRLALKHIRAMWDWLRTDRTTPPPEVPAELAGEL